MGRLSDNFTDLETLRDFEKFAGGGRLVPQNRGVITLFHNGLRLGKSPEFPPEHLTDSVRGNASGWNAGVSRRNLAFLYSVVPEKLTGKGIALTLTLRDIPSNALAFHRLRLNWFERQRRSGLIRAHWVIEWQKRGAPHLHITAYFPPEKVNIDFYEKLVFDWLEIARAYNPSYISQHKRPIAGVLAWLGYVSKHASKGLANYQRGCLSDLNDRLDGVVGAGETDLVAAGWKHSTGRMWGRIGSWPLKNAVKFYSLPDTVYNKFRRIYRRWHVASVRGRPPEWVVYSDHTSARLKQREQRLFTSWKKQLTRARACLRRPEKDLSQCAGLSGWMSLDLAEKIINSLLADISVYDRQIFYSENQQREDLQRAKQIKASMMKENQAAALDLADMPYEEF